MTKEDFEAITAIKKVLNGLVRIELQYLGFCFIARHLVKGKMAEVRKILSYEDATSMHQPVDAFKFIISDLMEELNGLSERI